jgi:23S rRNA (cytosine1962-C5)-methyltransferase
MTCAVSDAVRNGAEAVVCASTGNTAASLAAYAARAGIGGAVIVPEGKIAAGKLAQALMHGARVIALRGNFDQALEIVRELARRHPVELVNSVNPYRIEGQKTGAFLDQRPNRLLAGELAAPGGRALDCFAYHGSFAVHLARRAGSVLALDASGEALARGAANAALNGQGNIEWREVDAFETLRAFARARERFDTIVLDPPAFAKSRGTVAAALRGYHEINLRAMRCLAPGGTLLTASCSYHVRLPEFLAMLGEAAADSGRRVLLRRVLGQGIDHPEVLTIPETSYLKGAVLQAE